MNNYKLDARGLACPLPVVQTKKLLADYASVTTLVDNFTATQNLNKLALQLDYRITIKELAVDNYEVTISKENNVHVINTLADSCVIPVTQAKRALEKENKIEIYIRDEVNVEKLREFSLKNNYDFSVVSNEDNFVVTITKQDSEQQNGTKQVRDESYIVVINKKIMGHGSEELGKRLIKAYLYALTEQEVLPSKIIFYNDGGVLVDKKTSHVLEELRELEDNGVEIVCCGACIDYHNIDLAVGNPTNMYFIVEDMRKANRIIRP